MPPNCRIEVDDINLGLEHFYNKFDIVHARLISSGVRPSFPSISITIRLSSGPLDQRLPRPNRSHRPLSPSQWPRNPL